jgi:hypothetical protein
MPRYNRSDIEAGVFLTLDAPVDRPLKVYRRPKPTPVRYGDAQPFAEVSARLDEARTKLEKLRADLREHKRQ